MTRTQEDIDNAYAQWREEYEAVVNAFVKGDECACGCHFKFREALGQAGERYKIAAMSL